MENEKTGPSFGARVIAVVVLAIAAWILLKVVIGIVAGVAWFVVVDRRRPRRPLGGAHAVLERAARVAYLVIAFFFGLAGGVVGKIKGSSFFLWFLISAHPAVHRAGRRRALPRRVRRAAPPLPGCGKVVQLHDALCTRCGTELEFPERRSPRLEPVGALR